MPDNDLMGGDAPALDGEGQSLATILRLEEAAPSGRSIHEAMADQFKAIVSPAEPGARRTLHLDDPQATITAWVSGEGRIVPGGIPPRGASSVPTRDVAPAGRAMTMPSDPSSSAQVPPNAMIGNQSAASVSGSPLGQRIPALMKALASPYIEGGQRELASMLLKQALGETAMPDSVKEFMWARAHGMTQAASPNAYALEKQRNPGADLSSQVQARQQAAQQYGLQPGTPEFRSYVLTGKEPTDRDEGAKITSQIEARRAQASSLGLQEGTPSWRSFVATGKVGADRDMSAGDKKAIDTADNAVLSAQASIGLLEQAKDLSRQAYGGPFASQRGQFMSIFGGEAGRATQELDNLVTTNALTNLKSIFGGNPTEGERKILLDVAGSSNMPHETRVKIYQRAIDAAQLRMQQNTDRAAQIREGTYYRPGSGPGQPPQRQAPSQAPQQNGRPAGASSAADRFGQLIGSGMTKAQAYEQMHSEGF